MVILDMASRVDRQVRVFTVDSGRLHQETHDLMDRVRERYGLAVEVYAPDPLELEPFIRREGTNPFYRDVSLRLRCCEIRKVNPLRRALTDTDAWITGVRRDQAATRSNLGVVEVDREHGDILKINPLVSWTEEDVWAYLRRHDVPYNALYDRGYRSIGCQPCTRPVEPGEGSRAGRWWWEQDVPKECGIHWDRRLRGGILDAATAETRTEEEEVGYATPA
jgi:thioredoxin-dependent adenylylsulfate APS reductase